MSTKAVNKASDEQPPSGKYDDAAHDTKKDTQGVSTGVLIAVSSSNDIPVSTVAYVRSLGLAWVRTYLFNSN